MASITLIINNKGQTIEVDPQMPLLWAIRDVVGLKGTKYGCGVPQCGACVVHMDGEAARSCVTKVSRAEGKNITTIEGLSTHNDHPIQLAWQEIDGPHCGYCHSACKLHDGEGVEEAAKLEAAKAVKLKKRADDRLIGKSLRQLDTPLTSKGAAVFGLDKQGPGMLFTAEEHNPRLLSKVKSFDDTEARKVPAVQNVFKAKMGVLKRIMKTIQKNFYDYHMPGITDIPPIVIHIMDNDADAGGGGEPGLPPFAPALTNAIFDLTGKRIRKLPFELSKV